MNIFRIISKFVYPSIKRRLVEILYKELKITQKRISSMLYISQSTISRYLSMERGSYLDISICKEIDKDIRKFAEILLVNALDEYTVEYHLAKITLKALGTGCICKFHKQISPDLDPQKCRICMKLFKQFAE